MFLECPVCLIDKPRDDFPEIQTCHHRSCSFCLKQYFRIEIMESRVGIACPECSELFHPNDIKTIVEDDDLTQKYEDFMLRRVLVIDPDTRWCPAPDCGYAVIATGCASCPKLRCEREGCNTNFCYHCKQYWHPNQTCDAARAERSPNVRSVSVSYSQESTGQNEIKSCPRCSAFIIKMDDESCNHMTCAVCEAHFCWLCLKEVSDLHYLSPSGCTFWGRKQWSRKKKILWQLGILVGAPVGITLVAGLAVPAMIIGIPVWVGKKIHYRYELASRRKRSLAITGSVAASIFAAPIVATLAVGIGVPILLTYIYGVVPISLCRSGGCGVTTTNSGGVRFEFDEDNENNARGGAYSYTGDYHSMETGPNVANPSIAPSIGDASLGMTNSLSASGSHMDRVGVLRDDSDRDSSSHRAMAGTSINGSLCSATYSSQHHKLEVQADISEHGGLCDKTSMGGESYNISLNDDASTKALAGSIVSPKDKDGVSVCSRLFVDGSGNVTSTAPLVYPEEVEVKESHAGGSGGGTTAMGNTTIPTSSSTSSSSSSSSNANSQQQTSSSCPTSPNLRKSSSPAPTDDNKSTRSKKCTRFMDQVPEIDDMKYDRGGGSVSVGSMLSEGSHLGLSDSHHHHGTSSSVSPITTTTTTGPPTFSTMSLTSAPTSISPMAPVLNSSHSLASEAGSTEIIPSSKENHHHHHPTRMGKMKAESTGVLMGSVVESRRFEMAGGYPHKGDSNPMMTRYGGEESCNKPCGRRSDKEHGSQPINLSDISQVSEGMSVHHTTGCHDLLSAMDTSGSDTNFLGRAARMGGGVGHKSSSYFHNSISSSSSSSMDDSGDFVSSSSMIASSGGGGGGGSRRFSHKHSLGRSLEGVQEDFHTTGEIGGGGGGGCCKQLGGGRGECQNQLSGGGGSCCLTEESHVGVEDNDDGDDFSDKCLTNNNYEILNRDGQQQHRQSQTEIKISTTQNDSLLSHEDDEEENDNVYKCPKEKFPNGAIISSTSPFSSSCVAFGSKRDFFPASSSSTCSGISHSKILVGRDLIDAPDSPTLPEVEVTSPSVLHHTSNGKESAGEILSHLEKVVVVAAQGEEDGDNYRSARQEGRSSSNSTHLETDLDSVSKL